MEQLITQRAERSIEEKDFPGCVIGVIKNDKRTILPFGSFTYEKYSPKVKENTLYDVASITKVIPASSAILMLVDQGKIHLNDPVKKYLPEFDNYPGKDKVTIEHLLTYTLDLVVPSMSSLKEKPVKEVVDIVIKAPLRKKPGESFLYTNSTAALFGLIVERVSGKKLDDFANENIFKPLGMDKSTFHPLEKFAKNEIAPTEISDWRGGLLQGEVHDESTYILQKGGYYLGAAGLFSTVPDLLTFAELILKKGTLYGSKIFSEDLVKNMMKDQLHSPNNHVGLGWEINNPTLMGKYAPEIIGKSGFTGCMIMINPQKQSGLVILSNGVYPKRPPNSNTRNAFRRDIADIVFKS